MANAQAVEKELLQHDPSAHVTRTDAEGKIVYRTETSDAAPDLSRDAGLVALTLQALGERHGLGDFSAMVLTFGDCWLAARQLEDRGLMLVRASRKVTAGLVLSFLNRLCEAGDA